MGKLNKDFTALTTFLIGDHVFTGNTGTGEWRRCTVAEYNANVASITPAKATPDLVDGFFVFDASTNIWGKITITEFFNNYINKATTNATPDLTDLMTVFDSSTKATETLTVNEFFINLATKATENTTPSLTDGVFIFDNTTKALERLSINQLLTAVSTNATTNTTPDLADGLFVFDSSTKAWEQLSIDEFLKNLGTKATENTTPDLNDTVYLADNSTKALERLTIAELFTRLGITATINGTSTIFAGSFGTNGSTPTAIFPNYLSSNNAGGFVATIEQNNSTGNGLYVNVLTSTGGIKAIRVDSTIGANRFYVEADGDVWNVNGVYGTISDRKLKENIVDAKSQWDDVKSISLKNYNLIADSENKKQLGVIAQDLEESGMNSLVRERIDYEKDDDGIEVESGTTTKSVAYSLLYLKAIGALQEAMKRIEVLESKIN